MADKWVYRFAEGYRRFVQMFGEIVLGVPAENLDKALTMAVKHAGVVRDADLNVDQLQALVNRYQEIIFGEARQIVPADPEEQLRMTIAAVFDSWMNRRAIDYRRLNGIANDIGTAVSIQAMVFGNSGEDSGTGVAFTRHPSTGEPTLFGEYLTNAQGEDVVAGIRTPSPISELAGLNPEVFDQLQEVAHLLEVHDRDMQDIEFTVEKGRLWMLQTRAGKRAGRAAVRIAVDMVREKLISQEEAVLRVSPGHVEQLLHPIVDPTATATVLAVGLPASPGAATGRVAFDADRAARLASEGEPVILVRHQTNPDDFHGMVAAQAVVTARGGMTSHAAVVARGMGKCCVAGCTAVNIEEKKKSFWVGSLVLMVTFLLWNPVFRPELKMMSRSVSAPGASRLSLIWASRKPSRPSMTPSDIRPSSVKEPVSSLNRRSSASSTPSIAAEAPYSSTRYCSSACSVSFFTNHSFCGRPARSRTLAYPRFPRCPMPFYALNAALSL